MPYDEDPMYERRRADALAETRFRRLEEKVDDVDTKVDRLSQRIAWIAGGLATLSLLANVFGPAIAAAIFGPKS